MESGNPKMNISMAELLSIMSHMLSPDNVKIAEATAFLR
jgi:hypothetical protein